MTIDLKTKIKNAKKNIIAAAEKEGGAEKLFISFSGGKDSTVLLHIARSIYPNMLAVFSNTTNELSDILKFVKTVDNIKIVKPKITFTEVLEKHGFPIVSKETSQKVYELKHTLGDKTRNLRLYGNSKGNSKLSKKWRFLAEEEFNTTHLCCKILKKDPLDKYSKETDTKAIVGLMAGESRLRQQLSLNKGGYKKVYPFLTTGWTDKDIWAYAKEFNIKFADCYYDQEEKDGTITPKRARTGCEFCAFGITKQSEFEERLGQSKKKSPKKFRKYMSIKNNGVTFEKAIQISIEQKEKSISGYYGYKVIKTDKFGTIFLEPISKSRKCPNCGKNSGIEIGIRIKKVIGLNKDDLRIYVPKMKCSKCSKLFSSKLIGISGNKYLSKI
jgi:3'-phosphoadenosine 5'-phosphosulfate sulfotransferase (PAPS reductase)/FAD synthetase